MNVLIWAIAVVAFVIAEVATVQLVSIWLAAGAFVTMIVSYFYDIPAILQLGIFIISSTVFLLLSFPMLRSWRNNKFVATNSELDVGKHATVIETISSKKGTGRVTLNGVNWSAVPENESETIPEGTIVIVVKVMGAKLIVKPE
ncbi:MAG: NfeD family protein [Ruminococcus sp.]|uniref:NfeD family protein n=1 Tax=Ruminococcus sp. TaxID=41978 RepID=UPI0025D80543|nr:NfeD family protein [Ruminococcus sp.]MCR5599404.1 NfeD family protein [Ruminococcus sp.]